MYTWGHQQGADIANGNLLGIGVDALPGDVDGLAGDVRAPQRLNADGMGPVAEVQCSTYTTIAITVDGRVSK